MVPAIYAQSIVVNRYFNSATSDGTGDVVELVVVQDHLDIRKWIIKDHGNGTAAVASRLDEGGAKYRFNDMALWANLRAGTVIVIRILAEPIGSYSPDVDASDFIIDVAINDPNYFIALSPASVRFNVTPHEAVMIRADVTEVTGAMTLTEKNVILNGANMAVHALAYGDFMTTAGNSWNNIKSPKAIFTNGSPGTYVGNGTVGMVTLTNPNVANYNTPLTKSTPLITSLPSYWVQQTSLTASMPYGIEVYNSTTNYSYNAGPTRKMNAYCVVFDTKFVEFKPTFGTPNKLPVAFQNDEPGTVLAVMNAGFFQAPSGSFSILKYDGITSASNIAQLTRTYNGNPTTYYPTRAAFGLSLNRAPDVAWIYNLSGVVYAYPTVSANALNVAPKAQPIAADGMIWNNVTAVGGSPMLIKGGNINITDVEELIVIDNASARARSAIGYTADGKIVMLAVEGNNPGVSDGLSLVELANYMKDMGCVGAINLDGGGSTTLRVGGQPMFTPSDGAERAMAGAILIKAKN